MYDDQLKMNFGDVRDGLTENDRVALAKMGLKEAEQRQRLILKEIKETSQLLRSVRSANKGVESPSLAASESRYIAELEYLNVVYLALGERIAELANKPVTKTDVAIGVAGIIGVGVLQLAGDIIKSASKHKPKY